METHERLVSYSKISTTSSYATENRPSTECQWELARLLEKEMKELGVQNVRLDEKCYLYGEIPATKGYEQAPRIGFIAHIDTAPDFNGENVNPRVIENYDGRDIELCEGKWLKTEQFPHLKKLVGDTLVVTDGTSLLGADDKSGVAVIMTAAEKLVKSDMPHGKVCLCFNPDEEIGKGAWDFDVDAFGADFAYTLDASAAGQLIYECFNGSVAWVNIKGFNIHPGTATGRMINAGLIATEFASMLPENETPRGTSGYEGFFHLSSISGNTAKATMRYIIRDHDKEKFLAREALMRSITEKLNEKYGEGVVELTIEEQYSNMADEIKKHFHLIEIAKEAIIEAGLEPQIIPLRGGTDGAQLTTNKGLPCPDLGEGSFAHHGPYEHASKKQMDQTVQIVLNIVRRYGQADPSLRRF